MLKILAVLSSEIKKSGLRMEYTPLLASSDVSSQSESPSVVHSGSKSGYVPCSKPSKYTAPGGVIVGAIVVGSGMGVCIDQSEELEK